MTVAIRERIMSIRNKRFLGFSLCLFFGIREGSQAGPTRSLRRKLIVGIFVSLVYTTNAVAQLDELNSSIALLVEDVLPSVVLVESVAYATASTPGNRGAVARLDTPV